MITISISLQLVYLCLAKFVLHILIFIMLSSLKRANDTLMKEIEAYKKNEKEFKRKQKQLDDMMDEFERLKNIEEELIQANQINEQLSSQLNQQQQKTKQLQDDMDVQLAAKDQHINKLLAKIDEFQSVQQKLESSQENCGQLKYDKLLQFLLTYYLSHCSNCGSLNFLILIHIEINYNH